MKKSVPAARGNRSAAITSLIVSTITRGGIVVLPTDTLYGVCGSALQPKVVSAIYRLRQRDPKKPFIVLIPSVVALAEFGVILSPADRKVLRKLWPGKVSVVLPVPQAKFRYLHRGTKTIAFRVPKSRWLQSLIRKTGPLVAPSANPAGKTPALTIREAEAYFGSAVDLYVDGGPLRSKPSTLVSLKEGGIDVLRRGAVVIKDKK